MLITLTTDFGYTDPFVGIMKGVICGINPQARIVDLSHGIPAQNIMAAALVLRQSAQYFPRGTIHAVVVDPGVGSARRPLLVELEESYFIGPDNGVLSLVMEAKRPTRIVHLSNPSYQLAAHQCDLSRTRYFRSNGCLSFTRHCARGFWRNHRRFR